MFCTQCGVEIKPEDRFCSQCGVRTAAGRVETPRANTLTLDRRNRKIAGVCAGLARYLDTDPVLVRVIWLAVALTTGVGFLAYLAAWIIMPAEACPAPQGVPSPYPQQSY